LSRARLASLAPLVTPTMYTDPTRPDNVRGLVGDSHEPNGRCRRPESIVEFGFIWVSSVQVGVRSELSMGWVEPWVGLGWVGLGQSADGLGWIGSHEMDPWTTVLETQKVEREVTDCS